MNLTCPICGHTEAHWLGDHIVEAHGLTLDQFAVQHPGSPLASDDLMRARDAQIAGVRRAHPKSASLLTVDIGGLGFGLNAGVPDDACLPMPDQYALPRHGKLGHDVRHVLVSLFRCRSIYVWGFPGTGKDALFHAWSALTRTPAIIKQVIPGTDIETWFFSRGFNEAGTHWEEGDVLKALRDGYLTEEGRRVPYLFLISDIDRSDRSQAEHFRLVTDSIKGRISGPHGQVYTVLPGTRIAATANTPGAGDPRGRMVSANPIDASILDRFDRKYKFHYMEWKDEGPIAQAKFPVLTEMCPGVFAQMGKATAALRDAVEKEELYAEFSHRGLCSILGHAEDLLICSDRRKVPGNLLKKAARAWLDGLPDDESRKTAEAAMQPHIKGGVMNQGNTGHMGNKPVTDI